jgi:glycosyltransferase involved in cell wall biosynthesis
MKKSGPMTVFLNVAYKLRPFLVRFVPRGFLRAMKRGVMRKASSGIAAARPLPFRREAYPDGVNIIASVRSASGIGQGSRLMAYMLDLLGIDYCILKYMPLTAETHSEAIPEDKLVDAARYNINLIHLNPHELPLAYLRLSPAVWNNRYNIAYWAWELEEFPDEWMPALNLMDEIWTCSDFAGMGLKKKTQKPQRVIPHPISAPDDPRYDRAAFGLPDDKFLFLCMYASGSLRERKNPDGFIRAYKEAFPAETPDCGAVFKIDSANNDELALIAREMADYKNIYIITETMEKTKANALIRCADAYVSLHRAEGFGLVMSEAMFLGTPVVATNWSGNTEFMNEDVACMVDCRLVTIDRDIQMYKKGQRWAEPDEKQAAKYMRRLYEDRDFGRALAEKARVHIAGLLDPRRIALLVRDRMEEIYRGAESTDTQ